MHFRSRQDERDVRRRFFERLQQCIESRHAEHMHFFYDIELGLPDGWRKLRSLNYLAEVIDTSVGGSVYLDKVGGYLASCRNAIRTFVTRLLARRCEAIGR